MTLRVACAGAGYFAQFHYDSWRRMDRVALVGACDRDKGRALATLARVRLCRMVWMLGQVLTGRA